MTEQNVPRSDALVLTGYFLSRCTDNGSGHRPKPPKRLGSKTWSDAYDAFFVGLGSGRTKLQFRNTLRNSRDAFDPLFDNGRRGWLDDASRPTALSDRGQKIHDDWLGRSDEELAVFVLKFRRQV